MSSISNQLFNILQHVEQPGDFYATGQLEIFPPRLEVEGVGQIALPLLPIQAEQLVTIAEHAPYGRGLETLVDTEVRRTWQIDAKRVTLSGKHWQKNLDQIVSRAAQGLGVSGDVSAELYKLLVYDAGSFFISHRDTEKAPGMFATLVIVLPSLYSGGELAIKHQQQEVKLDLRCDDPSEVAFAAFYADCVHEVLPITEGCRLTLIYNLLRTDKKMPLPRPPDYRREQEEVTSLLRNWASELSAGTDEQLPKKLIYLLEHAYTPAELAFDALKNADAAIAEVLVAAAEQADCEIHLALISIEESGSAEYAGRSSRWDDDDFEIDEVYDRTETVSEWRRLDGQTSNLPILPFSEGEFCPPEAFEDIETDDVEFSEATGNEGASFERTYRCAALVLWPRDHYLAIINQAGLELTLPVLKDFCQRWESDQNSSLWHEAHTLAGYMLRDWLPESLGSRNFYVHDSAIHDFLDDLCRLRDTELLGRFWSLVAKKGFYNKAYSIALVQSAALLPWSEVVSWTEQAISISAITAQEACAALLAGLSKTKIGLAQDLSTIAHTLFMVLPGDPERFPLQQPWERSRITVSINLVADVLIGFSAIDTALAENVLDYFLAWPDIYAMDKILVPVALQLTETVNSRELLVVERLRNAVKKHLQARIAEILEPPADWRRDSEISCACKDCAELRVFLDDPEQSKWSFKAAEARRKHIQSLIQRHRCDVSCKTLRVGSPHNLVCSKNQDSYQRRVEQRNHDLDMLARLTSQ